MLIFGQKLNSGLYVTRSRTEEIGVPVICLHGIGSTNKGFSDQHFFLGRRQVIAWDMPGYGLSKPLATVSFANLADQVIKLLDELGINCAHLVGHSIGGMIAQEVSLKFSDRISSLCLIATTAAFGGKNEKFKREFLFQRLAQLDDGKCMKSAAKVAINSIKGPCASLDFVNTAIEVMAEIEPSVYREMLSCLVTFDRYDEQSLIAQPVCLIAGSHDSNVPVKTMSKMRDKMPKASLTVIEGAGHLVHSEMPAATNKVLVNFLDKIESMGKWD